MSRCRDSAPKTRVWASWRDWDRDASPLGSINVITQYGDEPLKTDNPRKVPVHRARSTA
ncbi:MAG TPA: hypothetical protein VG937_27085 [Polyangiaceae bacterium]|nr:hypothetical protein [Polyangiaceae bacterium]